MQTIKCVMVGDSSSGKKELLFSFLNNRYPQEYTPTVVDTYPVTVMIGDEPYTICVFDTPGDYEYERLRPLSYPQTDVFLVIFSVICPISFKNAKEWLIPEIKHHCPNVPFLLVGTEIEKRTDPATLEQLQKMGQSFVSPEEGRAMAMEVFAVEYRECSALTRKGLMNVFDEAILAALEPPGK